MSKRLPIPVRGVLREPFDNTRLDAMVRAVRNVPRVPSRVRVALALGGGLAALVAVALLVGTLRSRQGGPLHLADGMTLRTLAAGDARSERIFEDGSRIALAPHASVEALVNDPTELVLLLRGTATFDVTPGGPRRWTVECALASVSVVGTRFTIEQTPGERAVGRMRVSVEHGAVLVRGERVPERARRLAAGEELVIVAESAASQPSAAMDLPSASRAVQRPPIEVGAAPLRAEESEVAALQPRRPPSSTAWRTLAESGAWDRAYAELGAQGIVREAPRADVAALLALADVARLSGHPSEAVAPLERLIAEHPSDPNAALAAFTLGRVEADQLGRPERAARAFDRALTLGLPAALRAGALARLASAHQAAAHAEDAARIAARYLDEYPAGPQADAMRALRGRAE